MPTAAADLFSPGELMSPPGRLKELDLLARTHVARLASFLRRRVGNPEDVEDLVQDTFLKATRCIDQFQVQSRQKTWPFGIALNLTRNHYKRAKVPNIYTDADIDYIAASGTHDPSAVAEHGERVFRVASVFEELPGDSRRLLQLIIQDDLSYEEAAHELGIPTGTVRSRVWRTPSFVKSGADGGRRADRSLQLVAGDIQLFAARPLESE